MTRSAIRYHFEIRIWHISPRLSFEPNRKGGRAKFSVLVNKSVHLKQLIILPNYCGGLGSFRNSSRQKMKRLSNRNVSRLGHECWISRGRFIFARSTVRRSVCIPIKGFAVTNVPPNMKSRVCYVCSDKPDTKNEDKFWTLFSPTDQTIIFNTKLRTSLHLRPSSFI